jgi:hypothetical protein
MRSIKGTYLSAHHKFLVLYDEQQCPLCCLVAERFDRLVDHCAQSGATTLAVRPQHPLRQDAWLAKLKEVQLHDAGPHRSVGRIAQPSDRRLGEFRACYAAIFLSIPRCFSMAPMRSSA